ncbi:hypothetical protein PYCC9005_003244 [Savitreella phatthalungensis]
MDSVRPPTYGRHRQSTLVASSQIQPTHAPDPFGLARHNSAYAITSASPTTTSRAVQTTLHTSATCALPPSPPSYTSRVPSLRRYAAESYFRAVLKRDVHMTMGELVRVYRTELSDCLCAQLLQIEHGDWNAYARLRSSVNQVIGEVVVPAMDERRSILRRAPQVEQPLEALKQEIRTTERRHHGEFLAESEYHRVFGSLGKAQLSENTGTRHDPELMGVDDYARLEKRAKYIARQICDSDLGHKLASRFEQIADACRSRMRVSWENLMDAAETQKQAYLANIDPRPDKQEYTSVFARVRRASSSASSSAAAANEFAIANRHKQLMLCEAHSSFTAINALRHEFEACVNGETRKWPPVRDFWRLATCVLASPRRAARTIDNTLSASTSLTKGQLYDTTFIDPLNRATNDAAERCFAAITDWLICCMVRASLAGHEAAQRTTRRMTESSLRRPDSPSHSSSNTVPGPSRRYSTPLAPTYARDKAPAYCET